MIDICELLSMKGFSPKGKVKMVRHRDNGGHDIPELCRRGMLEIYQSYQSNPIFECEYVVSFIGRENTKAVFYGVYRVRGRKPAKDVPLPPNYLYQKDNETGYYYELEEVAGFEDYRDRVVIEWGQSPHAWHQLYNAKEVVEILPKGYVKEFTGYLDFTFTFEELKNIINHPDANRIWHQKLSAVAGIYLITDTRTGQLYVGSACGKDGILGRWADYARTSHGGNKKLEDLLVNDKGYADNFQFTILQTLEKSLTRQEVVAHEGLFMKKLGSRVNGLNS